VVRPDLTREQTAICDVVRDSGDRGSLKVHAFAGTGKTSTLVAIANACPNRQFLYVAFNKAAQEEAARKMPSNAWARTAHSLAFAAVGRAYSDRLTIDRWPWLSYLREQRPEILRSVGAGGRDEFSCGALIQKTLERYLRTTDVSIRAEHAPSWCDAALASLAASAAGALWEEVRKEKGRAPVTHDSYLKQFFLGGGQLTGKTRTVLLDEAQDADPVILALVQRHQGGRVLVGDAYQQLYQWRGAINALRQATADAILPLTQTFRFGAHAASLANEVLGALGEARKIVPASHATTVSIEGDTHHAEIVLARSNAGVLDEAVRFLDRRLRVHVMGRVDALIRLIEDAWALRHGRTARGELSIFANWEEFRRAAFGDFDSRIPAEPGYRMLARLIEDRSGEVMRMRDRLRDCVDAPKKADVTISTVHKAKGLERQRVRVAGDLDQFFHRGKHGPEALFEEGCIMYVGITRARSHLSIHPDAMEALRSSVEELRKKIAKPAAMVADAPCTPPA
jgi:superfamily I DNA/RNA helicase